MHMVTWPWTSRTRKTQAGAMLVPLLGAVTVLAVGVAAVAIVLQFQERDKRQAKERELHVATTEIDTLTTQVEKAQGSLLVAEEDLSTVRLELGLAQDELVRAAESQEVLTKSIEDREQEIARLSTDVVHATQESETTRDQMAALRSEYEGMTQQLDDLEQAKADLETKVLELSGRPTVELAKIRVAGDYAGGGMVMPVSVATQDGQVVVINREYDFIVMNLGKNHGLTVGQEFKIVRDNEVLGRVRVEKVYDELSAAALLPNSKKNSIREGDLVTSL